jgi:hypothetical protein
MRLTTATTMSKKADIDDLDEAREQTRLLAASVNFLFYP